VGRREVSVSREDVKEVGGRGSILITEGPLHERRRITLGDGGGDLNSPHV